MTWAWNVFQQPDNISIPFTTHLNAMSGQTATCQGMTGVNSLATSLNGLNGAVPVDHKRRPLGEMDDGHQHAILARDRAVIIAQDGISQPERLCESLIPGGLIHANADHLGALILESGDISLIRLQFLRSAARESLDVKCQNDCLAPLIVAEPHHFAILIRQAEIRRMIAHLKLP